MLRAGVLAGAIDYYIVAKFQNLRNDALYTKVTSMPLLSKRKCDTPFLISSTCMPQHLSACIYIVISSYLLACMLLCMHKQNSNFAARKPMQVRIALRLHCNCWQDDFKITKKLATGGFGTVYRAELDDGKTPGGRPVIIKKVRLSALHQCLRCGRVNSQGRDPAKEQII